MHNPFFLVFLVGGSLSLSLSTSFSSSVSKWASGINSKLRGVLELLIYSWAIQAYLNKTHLFFFLFLKSMLGPGSNLLQQFSFLTEAF